MDLCRGSTEADRTIANSIIEGGWIKGLPGDAKREYLQATFGTKIPTAKKYELVNAAPANACNEGSDVLDNAEQVAGKAVVIQRGGCQFLEKAMKAMYLDWETCEFECLAYKNTGTYLVKGVDEIIALLDDHIVKTQTMRGSPFIKPIATEAANWEHKLHNAQAILDEWTSCQRTWLYLQPIFDSEDIMRQMPQIGRAHV